MPLTNRRRARRNKEIKLQETSDAEAPDSSPTRPSNKKRKVNRRQPSPQPRQPVKTEESADEADDSSPDNEVSENQDLVDMVISCLSVPRDDVRVMRDHSNAKTENKQSIRAYAKIAGRNWTYYVKTLHVNIGREPDREQRIDEQSSPVTIAARALPEVHVDLGPGKFVSRLHAEIFYDGEQTAAWHIRVNGRNGVRLNNVVLKRGTDAILSCGDIIEIANTQMMFVTPGDQANIHSSFVERAHRIANGEESQDWDAAQHAHPRPPQSTDDPADSIVTAAASGGQASLASAPHILKRQVTPPPRSPDTSGARTAKHSPLYNRGMMMESTEEIDYSKDSAKDLKPPYSYATLIAQAIFSSEEEKLTLNHIYTWIVNKYAFYRHSQSGWQNSIRHNLSLNKAFQKVPRRTDEPGKGMKWQIVPEYREEYWRRQARKGNQSSAPSSPATKDVSSRNANGLGTVFSAGKRSPQLSSPGFSSFPVAPVEAYTPERGSRTAHALRNARPDYEEPSPLPTRTAKKSLIDNNDNAGNNSNSASTASRAYGLSDNVAKSPPILSSSYYDDGPSSMITPAPQRQQPRLPPPSTAQIPSKFMPMSSPAQFWKFAEIGSTPARPVQDTSPLKGESGDGLGNLPSSSPPPDLVSPSKPGMAFGHGGRSLPPLDEGDEGGEGEEEGEGEGEEREKEEEAGGERKEETEKEKEKEEEEDKPSYNNNNNNANGAGSGSSQDQDPPDGNRHNNDNKPGPGDDEEEEEGGFDLARGFQPIGSYHRQMSNAARATATS